MRAKPTVLKTTATTGDGIAALAEAIAAAAARRSEVDRRERRRRRARYLIARAAADLIGERIRAGQDRGLDALADKVLTGRLLPAEAARRLLDK